MLLHLADRGHDYLGELIDVDVGRRHRLEHVVPDREQLVQHEQHELAVRRRQPVVDVQPLEVEVEVGDREEGRAPVGQELVAQGRRIPEELFVGDQAVAGDDDGVHQAALLHLGEDRRELGDDGGGDRRVVVGGLRRGGQAEVGRAEAGRVLQAQRGHVGRERRPRRPRVAVGRAERRRVAQQLEQREKPL